MTEQQRLNKYFEFKCWKGLEHRGLKGKQEYEERLKYEIGVIERMGFPSYFLIVADFLEWARKNDIPVGPGRGSAAGSLASYCIGITDLDPIRFGLLFERFLNPDRAGQVDYARILNKVNNYKELTTDQLVDILESGGLNDPRLQNIKRMP